MSFILEQRENPTHTSRTTSGSIRVRSSPLSSLQHMPSSREFLAHFAVKGVGCRVSEASIGHTGGFELLVPVSVLRGRGTDGAAGVKVPSDMEVESKFQDARVTFSMTKLPSVPYQMTQLAGYLNRFFHV
jgi:hypothetical protein